jgi:hypothetical protein
VRLGNRWLAADWGIVDEEVADAGQHVLVVEEHRELAAHHRNPVDELLEDDELRLVAGLAAPLRRQRRSPTALPVEVAVALEIAPRPRDETRAGDGDLGEHEGRKGVDEPHVRLHAGGGHEPNQARRARVDERCNCGLHAGVERLKRSDSEDKQRRAKRRPVCVLHGLPPATRRVSPLRRRGDSIGREGSAAERSCSSSRFESSPFLGGRSPTAPIYGVITTSPSDTGPELE